MGSCLALIRHASRRPAHADAWPGLSADEREYRAQVLDRIAQRVAADGVRVSVPSPDRGSQFMPFAALKGYEEVIAEVENGNVEEALDAADAQAEEASPEIPTR